MADRYWVGGAGTWNTTNTANWSDTSGGAGGFSVPTEVDDVYFNTASNVADYTVTLSSTIPARSINFGAPSSGNLTVAGSGFLVCYGNFTIAAAGVLWTSSSEVRFFATSGEWIVTTNGVSINRATFGNAAASLNASWSLAGALTTSNNFTISGGCLVTNSYAITALAGGMNLSGGFCVDGTTTFSLVGTWSHGGSTGTLFSSAPDVTIVQNGTTAGGTSCPATFQFGRVNIAGTAGASTFTSSGGNFYVGRFTSTKTSAHTIQLPTTSNRPYIGSWEITGTAGNVVTVNGSQTYPLRLGKQTSGINYINAVNVYVNDANFGSAEFYIGPNSTIQNGTGRIYASNPPAPVTRYWVGGTGTWNTTSTTNWSDSSGGAGGASVPTSVDTVIFDAASSAGSYTVTRSGSTLVNGSITYGAPATGTLTISGGGTGMYFGDVTVASVGVSGFSGGNITAPYGVTNTYVFPSTAINLYLYGSGTFSLGSALSGNTIIFPQYAPGLTLRTNGYAVSTAYIDNTVNGYLVLDAATTTWTHTTNAGMGGFYLSGSIGTYQNSNSEPLIYSSPALSINTLRTTSNFANFIRIAYGTTSPQIASTNKAIGVTCGTLSFASPANVSSVAIMCPVKVSTNFTTNNSGSIYGYYRHTITPIPAFTTTGSSNTVYAGVNTILEINGTTTLTDVDFWGVTVTGTAAPISGTRLGDAGFNSGITFPAPKTVYWNGGSSTTFASVSWAATDGGTAAVANYPLPQDTMVFTNTSPSSGSFISASSERYWFGAFDVSARTTNLTFSSNAQVHRVFGDITLSASVVNFFANIPVMLSKNGTQTLNSAGVALSNIGVSNYSGNAVLARNTSVGTFIYDNGNFSLNNYVLTITSQFMSSGYNVSANTFAFGTGSITMTGTNFALNGEASTLLSVTGSRTVNVSRTSGTFTWTSSAVAGNALDVNIASGAFTLAGNFGAYRNYNISGFAGTFSNLIRTIHGVLNLGTTATLAAGTSITNFIPTAGTTNSVISNGRTLDFPITINGTGTFTLSDALVIGNTSITTLTSGTLDLNGFTLTTGRFSSSNSNSRAIAFGANEIRLSGVDSMIWGTAIATNFSFTGTFKVVATYTGSAGTRGIDQGFVSEATVQPVSASGSSGFIIGTASTDIKDFVGSYGDFDLTNMAGTLSTNGRTVYGNFNVGTTITLPTTTNNIFFNGTSGTKTITSNGRTFNFSINFNGAGRTWQFQDAITLGAARITTLTTGVLDLNGFTLTTGQFSSSNSNVRSIAFGSSNITLIGSGTVWTTSTSTNFTRTGTPTVNVANNSATATTVTTGGLTETQALDFNYTTGTYTLTDTNAVYRSLNLTGFAGTFPNVVNRRIFGNFNVGSTATLTAGTNAQTFAATSGAWGITSNGRALDFPLTFNGIGGTWQLQDALTVGATRLTTLTAGTLDLNGFTYTTGLFSSSGSGVRTIAFGTSQISLSGNNATIWDNGTATNFAFTGTFKVVATYTGGAGGRTLNQGANTLAALQPISTTGSSGFILDTVSTDSKSLSGIWGDVDLTGMSGSFVATTKILYGNFNAGTTATIGSGVNTTTFAATSGTKTITTNGRTLDFMLTFNGVGGTWQLQDALTMGASMTMTLTNGTFDANNYNVSLGRVISTNSNVRTLALGSGTWTVAGTGASAWTFATSTNATITGTATISMTGATAKTFAGGGLTWPTLNQGGAGALTITGNNAFTNITSTQTATGACAISFTAGSTQSVSNFTASGTAIGQLTLNSTTTSPYNLVKLGGGDVNVSFCTISYSNASP